MGFNLSAISKFLVGGAIVASITFTIVLSSARDSVTFTLTARDVVCLSFLGIGLVLAFTLLVIQRKVFIPLESLRSQIGCIAAERAWESRISIPPGMNPLNSLAANVNQLLGEVARESIRFMETGTKDQLTNLMNKDGMRSVVELEIERGLRTGSPFSIALLDLDNFKQLNNALGVRTGDLALKQLAIRMKNTLRKLDVVGRVGDDEFMVVLPCTNKKSAMYVAHKLHNTLNNDPVMADERFAHVTASIGLVTYPDDGADVESLLRAVCNLVYQAKLNGKNSVASRDADQDCTISINKAGHYNISRSLSVGDIEIALQPIVYSRDGAILGYEALARIKTADGLVNAEEFIDLAKANGVLRAVDERIFKKGLAQLSAMDSSVKIFFNFSQETLCNREWMRRLPKLVEHAGVSTARVVIEFTPRKDSTNSKEVAQTIRELKAVGIMFAIDNFGSGATSFMHLREFNVDYLKIDGSIINKMSVNKREVKILEAIQRVAQEFGIQTIAELVEDEATLDILNVAGIPFAQGYYFGPPISQYKEADWKDISFRQCACDIALIATN